MCSCHLAPGQGGTPTAWHIPEVLARASRGTWLAFAGVLAVALAARLTTWQEVFTSRGVRLLVDTDPHYHVLRAERLLRGGDADVWFDPRLNHPAGANVLWPPGFDAMLAAAARLLHGDGPTRSDLEHVAVFVPVALGMLAVLLQMTFAWRWLGRGAALVAGLLAALLPIQVQYGALGVVDQHVAEQLGFCAAVLGVSLCATTRRSGPLLVALALAVGPWMWQGAILTAAFVVLAATVVFVVRADGNDAALGLLRRVAVGGAAGGALLSLSLLLWGPPAAFRSPGLNGLSWIHPVSTLAGSLGLAALAAFARARPGASRAQRALAGAGVGAAACGVVLAAMPSAVLHGVDSLRATDGWRRIITEFQPAFGSIGSFQEDLSWVFWAVGPVLVAPCLALGAFGRRWNRDAAARTGLVLLATGTVIFVGLFLARSRFVVYAVPFLVWWGALFVSDAIGRARLEPGRARRGAVAALCAIAFLVPCAHLVPTPFRSVLDERLIALLGWMRAQEDGARRGVLAPWTLGHAIQYYADAPVVVTPFGTDLGPEGMRRLAAFDYARTPAAAEQVLREADVGWVLLQADLGGVSDAFAFAPPGSVPLVADTRDYWGAGRLVAPTPAFRASPLGSLYANDGASPRVGATGGIPFLRLVYETSAPAPFKAFERVEGARVSIRGAAPFESTGVLVEVLTNGGRRVSWSSQVTADAEGRAILRVPYATGQNGASAGSMYVAAAGPRVKYFAVPEAAVRRGDPVDVDLAVTDPPATAPPGR